MEIPSDTRRAAATTAQSPAGSFVLFADRSIAARGLQVLRADVGANSWIIATRRLDAGSSRIIADAVELDPASSCTTLLANRGRAARLCGPAAKANTVPIPVIDDIQKTCGLAAALPSACSGSPIVVGHAREPVKRDPGADGRYGDVDVAGGGQGGHAAARRRHVHVL